MVGGGGGEGVGFAGGVGGGWGGERKLINFSALV